MASSRQPDPAHMTEAGAPGGAAVPEQIQLGVNRMMRFPTARSLAAVACAVGIALGSLAPATAHAQAPARQISGQLANKTQYSLHVPERWNGTLVLNADLPGIMGGRDNSLYDALHRLGYATGGKARDVTGWDIREGSSDLVQLKALFTDRFGKPRHTIVTGRSLGGLVARDAAETYPDEFDGFIPACGGGAGLIAMWNQRLDIAFVAKTLLANASEPIELAGAKSYEETTRALKTVVERALASPLGRARLALIAAIGQISGWPAGLADPPPSSDFDTRLRTIAEAIAGVSILRAGAELPAGGSYSWNVGVDYRALFEAADEQTRAMANELYKRAGAALAADLETLAAAPRVQADAVAVAWARSSGALTGRLKKPTLVLFTGTDPRASISEFLAYEKTVEEAGSASWLRQMGVYRSGHCVFTDIEHITAIELVAEAIRTGRWPDTSARAMNERAGTLIERLGAGVGEAKFAAFPDAPAFPRRFNAYTPLPPGAIR